MPISTIPPRISARLPSSGPIKRPTIIPSVDMIKRGAADRQRGGHNADLQEGQTDADGHRVKAGGEGGGDQKPETMSVRRLARLVAVAAKTFDDHSPAEKHQ